jgi:hypothetical protein
MLFEMVNVPSVFSISLKSPFCGAEIKHPGRQFIMLEVTPAATQQIAAYFDGKKVMPIRIFLNEGG